MGVSLVQEQQQIIIDTIKNITRRDWKVLVLDETSKKIVDNVVNEDAILNEFISNIECIEDRREKNPTMDAIYLLSPQPHIVECLLADLDRRRYRRAYLVWTAVPDPQLRQRIDSSPMARQMIAGFEVLSLDFFPRESRLVTFRDPSSFPILYHPDLNNLVRPHMEDLAQKIANVCIALGEYPKVRYFRPKNPLHEASVLCTHLARFVQEKLDDYARWNRDFPPPSPRPPSILLLTDRAMDLAAPLVHEFTYQAMAHDLLPIRDNADKTTYHLVQQAGTAAADEQDVELGDKDPVWVDNRHRHMRDTIDKIQADFARFIAQNPHFADSSPAAQQAANLNTIRDMMAGLQQFQQMKAAFSMHISMAQACMECFQRHKLADLAMAEQTLATGLDEDRRKPRNLLDQVVRLLDDDAVTPDDRLRLLLLYLLFRDGVIPDDLRRLLAHAALPPDRFDTAVNLELLGARPLHALKETRPPPPPLLPEPANSNASNNANSHSSAPAPTPATDDDNLLSRFQPVLRQLLDHLCRGHLDPTVFPYVHPPASPQEDPAVIAATQAASSLRAAKPIWAERQAGAGATGNPAGTNSTSTLAEARQQRIFVFVAGGATYSESRTCYDAAARYGRDIFLLSSHMLSPALFLRHLADLSANPRQLDIPLARPPPKPPAHLFERDPPPKPKPVPAPVSAQPPPTTAAPPAAAAASPQPPTKQLGHMSLGHSHGHSHSSTHSSASADAKPHKPEKDKKKRNLFGLKK